MKSFSTFVLIRFQYFAPVNFIQLFQDDRALKTYLYDEERLAYRLELMRNFCVPSLHAQSDKDFKVIILTSPELPKHTRQSLAEMLSGLDFEICDEPANHTVGAFANILSRQNPASSKLTIRLDDDDAIGTEWIGELNLTAKALLCHEKGLNDVAIAPSYGAIINFNHPRKPLVEVRAKQPASAGTALLNDFHAPENVYQYQHQKIGRERALVMLPTPFSFLRTLHSGNISHNRDVKQYQQFEEIEGFDHQGLIAQTEQAFKINWEQIDQISHYKDPVIKPRRA